MKVFVDGENFRQGLTKELIDKHLIKNCDTIYKYDVVGLIRATLLVDDPEIWYYASEVKMPQGYELDPEIVEQMKKIEKKANYWTSMLKEQGIRYIRAGNLKPKPAKACRYCGKEETILQEKGVDVRMALDIIEECLNPECEEIAVMSSDVDLCPVYQKAHRHWTKVRYICFADRVNRGVSSACYKTMIIRPGILKKHFEGVIIDADDTSSKSPTDDFVAEN